MARRRVSFNGDSTVKDPCWRWNSKRDLPTQVFSLAASPSLQCFDHFHGSTQSGPIKWTVLWETTINVIASKLSRTQSRLAQSLYALKEFAAHLLGLHALATESGFGFVSSTRSSQAVSHLSTILAQCCLTSVFKWELMFPTWHRPLTMIDDTLWKSSAYFL